MTRLALVRHGQTDWNRDGLLQGRSDIPLNTAGRTQATASAERLSGYGPTALLSSPLRRARETAQIISTSLGLAFTGTDPEIIERDYGTAEGLQVLDAYTRWPKLDFPHAEPLDALAARSRRAIERLAQTRSGIAVVTHGTFIRHGVHALTGDPVPRLQNGDVIVVRATAAGWRWEHLEPASAAPSERPPTSKISAPSCP